MIVVEFAVAGALLVAIPFAVFYWIGTGCRLPWRRKHRREP